MNDASEPNDMTVDKSKFDALLRKIVRAPALKESDRKAGRVIPAREVPTGE